MKFDKKIQRWLLYSVLGIAMIGLPAVCLVFGTASHTLAGNQGQVFDPNCFDGMEGALPPGQVRVMAATTDMAGSKIVLRWKSQGVEDKSEFTFLETSAKNCKPGPWTTLAYQVSGEFTSELVKDGVTYKFPALQAPLVPPLISIGTAHGKPLLKAGQNAPVNPIH